MNVSSVDQAFAILGIKTIKTASASDKEEYGYGDRDQTFRSYVAAHVTNSPAEMVKAAEHAQFWGITDKCRQAMEKLSSWRPAELSEADYALVKTAANGVSIKKYAAYDKKSTVKAATAFEDNKHCYPLEWRKEAAVRLLSRAKQYDADLPAYVWEGLHKSAGFGFASPESLERSFTQRMTAVMGNSKTAALAPKLGEALEAIEDNPEKLYDLDFIKQAMETLERFDVAAGLTDMDLPEDLISGSFTVDKLEKVASVTKLAVELVNGKTVRVDQLSKEALATVDPGLASLSSEELADVLPTLPKGDADLLVRLN